MSSVKLGIGEPSGTLADFVKTIGRMSGDCLACRHGTLKAGLTAVTVEHDGTNTSATRAG